MNKAKRGLMLAGAIVNVIYSGLNCVLLLIVLPLAFEAISLATRFGDAPSFSEIWAIINVFLCTGLLIATLVMSCLLMPNPDKAKKKRNYGKLLIVLIVLNAILLILSFISLDILGIIFGIAICTLYIIAVCIHKEENNPLKNTAKAKYMPTNAPVNLNQSNEQVNAGEQNFAQQAEFYGCDLNDPVDRKIFRARQLFDAKMIDETELKDLLIQILSK